MTTKTPFLLAAFLMAAFFSYRQKIQTSDTGYFEKRGVNVFVFSVQHSPIFFDEKPVGMEAAQCGYKTSRNNET